MSLLNFRKNKVGLESKATPEIESLLKNYSIEVMPRTALKIDSFKDILPKNTRVYIAHIEGTPIDEMVATAARLSDEGFQSMPHFPARIIKDKATLKNWINRYKNEAGVDQALILAGGLSMPHGDFESSMQLLETGLFDAGGFKRLHVAGHPEGNKDIDPNGGNKNIDEALMWKQKFSSRTDAKVALATQFSFEPEPIINWASNLAKSGIDLPIHIGVAGPAKLQTLIKFAIACGVGPSLKVLQKRARDLTKLLLPYEPTDLLVYLANQKHKNPSLNIEQVHFFPLGGIKTNANWVTQNGGTSGVAANNSI
ncbi:MAG: methylenetetrahydrofolate reductase (NADPH) [Paracoccaceae bacterium]|jgi:methylenetetrahydrofolate reductase (NADPH)